MQTNEPYRAQIDQEYARYRTEIDQEYVRLMEGYEQRLEKALGEIDQLRQSILGVYEKFTDRLPESTELVDPNMLVEIYEKIKNARDKIGSKYDFISGARQKIHGLIQAVRDDADMSQLKTLQDDLIAYAQKADG